MPSNPQRRAIDIAADPVMFAQIRGFCRYLLSRNSLAAIFPGLTEDDLCQDVLLAISENTCASSGQFWKLFEITARRKTIDLLRMSQTRQKHMDLYAGHEEQGETESPPDSHHAFASQSLLDENVQEERVEEAARLLEAMPVKPNMRPVLEAIVHEARTGERISDKELSGRTGTKQNTICRMRERLRAQAALHLGLR